VFLVLEQDRTESTEIANEKLFIDVIKTQKIIIIINKKGEKVNDNDEDIENFLHIFFFFFFHNEKKKNNHTFFFDF
jgi:hypothetical protein